MTTSNLGTPGYATPAAPQVPGTPTPGGSDLPSVESLARIANDLFGSLSHGGYSPTSASAPPTNVASASSIPRGLPDNVSRQAAQQVSVPASSAPGKIGLPEEDRLKLLLSPRSSSKPTAGGLPAAPENAYYFMNGSQPVAGEVQPTSFQSTRVKPEMIGDAGSSFRTFDVQAIRRDFPILEERVNGRQLIWLDNAATTQKPQAVIDRLVHFYQHENSNIHRAAHELAARSTDAYEAAREKVRRFINASSTNEIVFVRGGTEAINLVAQSWGRQNIGAGDEIVITHLEHHANIVPWQQLASEKGAVLRVAPVDNHGQVLLDEYQKLLNQKTRLVAFPQVSNALGTVTPAKEIIAIARRYGAKVLIDAAQSIAHSRTDVQDLDVDWLAFSGHKMFGPTGIGVLYGREELLNSTLPWQGGGNMIQDVTFEKTSYQPAPNRFEAGTGNIADAVGLGAAIDYINRFGIENIARYEHDLLVYATTAMSRVPGLRLIGTAPEKAAVLSFVLDGFRSEDVGRALNEEGIAVRSGHHCAQPILRRFGVETTVRPSLAMYNTFAEIDTLVATLQRIASGHR
jgi:cysteine desulfurase/selenocysteine lyase